jgi:hypothetical protein
MTFRPEHSLPTVPHAQSAAQIITTMSIILLVVTESPEARLQKTENSAKRSQQVV